MASETHQGGGTPAQAKHYHAAIVLPAAEIRRLQEIVDFEDLATASKRDRARLEIMGDGRNTTFFSATVRFEDGCQADMAVLSGGTNAWVSVELFDAEGHPLCDGDGSECVRGACDFIVGPDETLYTLEVIERDGTLSPDEAKASRTVRGLVKAALEAQLNLLAARAALEKLLGEVDLGDAVEDICAGVEGPGKTSETHVDALLDEVLGGANE